MSGKSLEKLLGKGGLGKFNSHEYERFGLREDRFSKGGLSRIKKARDKVFSNGGTTKLNGPFKAICLYADTDPVGSVPFLKAYALAATGASLDSNLELIRVIARIPELHASIPKPIIAGESGLICAELRNLAMVMHPVFYSLGGTLPKPGNIVEVDFPDPNNRSYGTYLRIINSEAHPVAGDQSPADAVNNSNEPLETIGDKAAEAEE